MRWLQLWRFWITLAGQTSAQAASSLISERQWGKKEKWRTCMCECLQNGLVGRLAICRQLPAALPPSPPPASDGSVDTCHCIESITISHGDAKCDLDMSSNNDWWQEAKAKKKKWEKKAICWPWTADTADNGKEEKSCGCSNSHPNGNRQSGWEGN